jgi:SAM-dependent methyltransferase
MERVRKDFLTTLEPLVPLKGKLVLHVGCGGGKLSAQIAERCGQLVGIDSNKVLIETAGKRRIRNATFRCEDICETLLEEKMFDIVIFTLPLHRITKCSRVKVVRQVVRLAKPGGRVVVFKRGVMGSFHHAEVEFGPHGQHLPQEADYVVLDKHRALILDRDTLGYYTLYRFDTVEECQTLLNVSEERVPALKLFLEGHHYVLKEEGDINLYTLRP